MTDRILSLLIILLVSFVLMAGCSAVSDIPDTGANDSAAPGESVPSYHATLRQPDARSGYITMESDVYNIGEVVDFTVINRGSSVMACAGEPSFSVKFQAGNGKWATRMGTGEPDRSVSSPLAPGASTQVYRFVTDGWEPGRYRIVHDCGVEHEFLLRSLATVTPAPTVCPVVNASNSSSWITIDAIGDQYAGRPLTIRGTTNLPPGEELRCTIFPGHAGNSTVRPEGASTFTTIVEAGDCSIGIWSATGEIQATGTFVIMVSGTGQNATASREFTVLPP